jgi:hypothetical protein
MGEAAALKIRVMREGEFAMLDCVFDVTVVETRVPQPDRLVIDREGSTPHICGVVLKVAVRADLWEVGGAPRFYVDMKVHQLCSR